MASSSSLLSKAAFQFLLTTAVFWILEANACTPVHPVLNWDTYLGGTSSSHTPTAWALTDVTFNQQQLTWDISVVVPYIVESTMNGRIRGVTYLIDFDVFPDYGQSISQVNGECANREASSFVGKSFSESWTYQNEPWVDGNIGNASSNMQYGPSGGWTQVATTPSNLGSNGTCEYTNITFSRSFTFTEIQGCKKNDGQIAFSWADDNVHLNLTGVLHVMVVSPYQTTVDGSFKVSSLARVPITASFRRPAHLVANANVRNFGIEPQAIRYLSTDVVEMSFITWSPHMVRLDINEALLLSPDLATIPYVNGLHRIWESDYFATGGYTDCMITTPFRCFQRSIVAVNVSNLCPIGQNIDLSGTYRLGVNMHCNSSELSNTSLAQCQTYIRENPSGALAQPISWRIGCDRVDFSALLTGTLSFYETSAFINQYPTPPTFVVEEDTAWVQVEMFGTNAFTLEVLSVQIVSAYLCTVKPGTDMSGMDPATGNGGCIQNPNVDNGPNEPFYPLLMNGQVNLGLQFAVAIINSGGPDKARMSFTVPTMLRTEFYLHVKVQVEVLNGTNPVRRLLDMDVVPPKRNLQQTGNNGQTSTTFKNSQTRVTTTNSPTSNQQGMGLMTILVIVLALVIGIVAIAVGVWFFRSKMEARQMEEEAAGVSNALEVDVRAAVAAGVVKLDSVKTPLTGSPDHEDDAAAGDGGAYQHPVFMDATEMQKVADS